MPIRHGDFFFQNRQNRRVSKSYGWQNRMGKQSSDGPVCLPIRDVEAQIVWANSLVTDRDAESDGPTRSVTWSGHMVRHFPSVTLRRSTQNCDHPNTRERVQPQRLKLPEKPEMDEKEIDRASPMKNDAHGITQKRPKSHSVGIFLGRSVLCETISHPSVNVSHPSVKLRRTTSLYIFAQVAQDVLLNPHS